MFVYAVTSEQVPWVKGDQPQDEQKPDDTHFDEDAFLKRTPVEPSR